MKARFVRFKWENETRNIATFYFRPQSDYRYEAGQYAVINIPYLNPDNRGTERTMTLSSSPHEPLLSITMKIYSKRGSSFKRTLLSLEQDYEVTIYDAMGDLVLPLDRAIPLVFIAGGVGIASFVGMIKWLRHTKDSRNISLFYAISHPADEVLQQPFHDYALTMPILQKTFVASQDVSEISNDQSSSARLTAADILPHLEDSSLIYISGTESMVESIRMQLIDAGVSRQQIVFDYFDGYASL